MPTSLEVWCDIAPRTPTVASRTACGYFIPTRLDHAAPECAARARAFMDLIKRTFAATARGGAVYPSPGRAALAEASKCFTREALRTMCRTCSHDRVPRHPHSPLTRSQTLDHTTRALWPGTPLAIDRPMLGSGRHAASLVHRGVHHRRHRSPRRHGRKSATGRAITAQRTTKSRSNARRDAARRAGPATDDCG